MKPFSEYMICKRTGFIQRYTEKVKLPDYYKKWTELEDDMNSMINNDTLEEFVKTIPLLSIDQLTDVHQIIRAHSILTQTTSILVLHKGPANVLQILPKQIAVPLKQCSIILGIFPIMTHLNMAIANAILKNIEKNPLEQKIELMSTVTANRNWRVFQLETVRVELCFAPAVQAVEEIWLGILNEDCNLIIVALKRIITSLEMAKLAFVNFNEMDPDYFHLSMRQLLIGWSAENFPNKNGLGYENEDSSVEYIPCTGASAGQSPTLQMLDALFKINHSAKNQAFFDEMKLYMLKQHRMFLDDIWKSMDLPKFVRNHCQNEILLENFNQCLDGISAFRTNHMLTVTKFIINPAKKAQNSHKSDFLQEKGTGGQELTTFLKEVRDDVKHELFKK